MRVPRRDGPFDMSAVLELLAERGITRLMVEGGATLAASLVADDLSTKLSVPVGEDRGRRRN